MLFNSDLVDDLANQRVVVFVGSGVSASAVTRGGKRMKQWPAFLSAAARRVPDVAKRKLVTTSLGERDLLLAAELLKEILSPEQWFELIHEEFGQVAAASDLHKAIVKLDQRIVITTNFDKLLENVWNDPGIDATHYPQVVTRLDSEIFRILRDDRTHLVKLHGDVDEPSSLVFAKSDYMKHAYGNWAYAKLIETLLLTHTFLFIGFSMSDPAVSHLVEMHVQTYPDSRPHYIFLSGPIAPEMEVIARRLRHLFVMQYSPAGGHRELVTLIEELGASGIKRRKEIAAGLRRSLRP